MPTRATDPLVGFHFMIEVQGEVSGLFTEIAGLGSESEVIDHKVVDEQGHEFIQKIPGRMKYTDVTLKRGITAVMDFWTWRAKVEAGDLVGARKNGTITMFDQSYTPVAQWTFENGWPSKVTGPNFQSDSNAYGVEEMTVVFERMERTQ
jgi:phage tail-like protein